ncbi:recombinase family protein [Methylobacterium oxalidis]|uniref:Resolvase/invertase-type recombinase catalytic domain-containing protein n=1 Tax=Methylobacterium oxalidis TaxID=944322 RepID=A0A512IXW4_9HYPH|nr:recombinase family protein [Methylobacterium oxalidis]GEP02525.1 hypothetical protein MOX02_05630 [Methylobacterium oxalidis]GLS61734.1 hypothetical protein GCM10007888_01150 [Methylobacterium oxalidis]
MTIYGYARASQQERTLDAQLGALKAAGCETVFHETASAARAGRRQLDRLRAGSRLQDA